METPSQDAINTCRDVLEYCIADTTQNEPYAVNTIEAFEEALRNIPDEEEMGDVDE